MFIELIMIQCSQKGCDETLDPAEPIDLGPVRPLLFKSHSEAIKAGTAAGWFLTSEDLGGDLCPECIAKRQEPAESLVPLITISTAAWGPSPLTALGPAIKIRRELKESAAFLAEVYWGPDAVELEIDERYHKITRTVDIVRVPAPTVSVDWDQEE